MSARVKQAVNAYWEARAGEYDASPGHDVHDEEIRQRWRDLLASELDAAGLGGRPLDAVDVGCGTGFLALHLAALGHRVVGVDASPRMLGLAGEKAAARGAHLDLREGDADALPLPDAAADVLVERHVLWTMADPAVSLREWRRVLRPGGVLLLIEGDWRDRMTDEQLADGDPDFLREYAQVKASLPLYGGRPPAVVVDLARAAGLVAISATTLPEAELWEDARDRPGGRYLVRGRRPS